MPEPLYAAYALIREALFAPASLVRAVASGRRRGEQAPPKATIRPVQLKAGLRLSVVTDEAAGPRTRNLDPAADAGALDELACAPYGNWHLETATETIQIRVTKSGDAQIHRAATSKRDVAPASHDRVKQRLIDPDDPLFAELGAGADKRRQVDAFLRALEPVVRKAFGDAQTPLRVVDLGCGNAYLTFAAHRYLAANYASVTTVGVELREDLARASNERAERLGMAGLRFVAGAIDTVTTTDMGLDGVDVALALHACDTATDDALAAAVGWEAAVIVAAPCCHHDTSAQWKSGGTGEAVPEAIGSSPILRERLADIVTDALRADILRSRGYRTDVMEFVDSRHTPRNAMIRARRGGKPTRTGEDIDAFAHSYGVVPALHSRL